MSTLSNATRAHTIDNARHYLVVPFGMFKIYTFRIPRRVVVLKGIAGGVGDQRRLL